MKAVILDWAGTVIDSGVFGPIVVFMELFKNEGVPITIDEARGPMGKWDCLMVWPLMGGGVNHPQTRKNENGNGKNITHHKILGKFA